MDINKNNIFVKNCIHLYNSTFVEHVNIYEYKIKYIQKYFNKRTLKIDWDFFLSLPCLAYAVITILKIYVRVYISYKKCLVKSGEGSALATAGWFCQRIVTGIENL